jgi:UDP-N-acetyl-D-glucosamine dehydrogenase
MMHDATRSGVMAFDLVVVGVGYVGLPLARRACEAGLSVAGYDVSAEVVGCLARGESHVPDVPAADVKEMLAAGFWPTQDPVVLAGAGTVVICVPTGLLPDGMPDLYPLRSAAQAVAGGLRPGTLVVVESTGYPGMTQEAVKPILEAGGLAAGMDFGLAYSPERVDPGNRRFGIQNTPKIIAGYTPTCERRCGEFYQRLVDTVVVARGIREAEAAKLLENTYRSVNIALVNEFALICHGLGIDVWDVVRCAATKPFGFQEFRPGPGVGGHCIPVDPAYLAYKADREGLTALLVTLSQKVNAAMPHHVTRRVEAILAGAGKPVTGTRVLLLGVTYKADVSDLRESPAIAVAEDLMHRGASVEYHDPYAESFSVAGTALRRRIDLEDGVHDADLVVLLQHHRCYDPHRLARLSRLLFDTRGRADGPNVHRL